MRNSADMWCWICCSNAADLAKVVVQKWFTTNSEHLIQVTGDMANLRWFTFCRCFWNLSNLLCLSSPVFSLQDLCCRSIVSCTPVHLIDKLPLPVAIKSHLKSFSMANGMNAVMMHGRSYSVAGGGGGAAGSGGGSKGNSLKRSKSIRPPQSPPQNCSRSNCKIS